MDYIRELNALYHFMLRNRMPKSEFALLTALYMINNAEDWAPWFNADNELLGRLTGGYSRETINAARNGLKQKGRLDFRPGKQNRESAKYHIVPFCAQSGMKSDMKSDIEPDMKPDIEHDIEPDQRTKQRLDRNLYAPPVSPAEFFERFWEAYPNKVRRQQAEQAFLSLVFGGVPPEELAASASNYAEYIRLTGEKMCHPGNFLKNMVFEDFLPGKYKKPASKRAGGGFRTFPQNVYDFEQLEKEMLEN